MSSMIYIPVPVGEIIDRAVILEIKINRLHDAQKRENCRKEYNLLQVVIDRNGLLFIAERKTLKQLNEKLWDIQVLLRQKELQKSFDEEFIQATRQEFYYNDERARIKKLINIQAKSELIEEKGYLDYRNADFVRSLE